VVFSINKTDRHDITEILLNVALNTITLTIQLKREGNESSEKLSIYFISFLHRRVPVLEILFQDIEDVDFHTDASSLVARWSGFTHPHLTVTYMISIGTTKGGNDVVSSENVGTVASYKKTGLGLVAFKVCINLYIHYHWIINSPCCH
jgi:hypothetical protein